MSLKPILDRQIIKVDNHQWGTNLPNDWKDKNQDVHIDKTTKNYKLEGKPLTVRIKIPINSDRPITCLINGKKSNNIPQGLLNEIQSILSDKQARQPFVDDLVDTIKNYDKIMATKENASKALNRLAKHFELEWTEDEITTYLNNKLKAITHIFRDNASKQYFINFNQQNIKLGEIDPWSRHQINLNNLS
jgi:hypothetical protein